MKKSNIILVYLFLFLTCFILNHKIYSQVIQSDDFNSPTLNTSLWTFIDPLNDGSYTMTGFNSGNASIDITVPAGADHDVWTSGITAARIMQPAADTDFEIEVKFKSVVSTAYQMQGILIEQEPGHVIRLGIYSDGDSVIVYGAIINNPGGITDPPIYAKKYIGLTLPPYYLRVKRIGDDWNLTYSLDGIVWINALTIGTSFNYAMNVSSVGVYSGNHPGTVSHTAIIDYFFNTDDPIVSITNSNLNAIPTSFALDQNYPNPFNPSTIISYQLPEQQFVNVVIFNILGEEVSTLVNEVKEAGYHKVEWSGTNLTSGVYFYRITTDGFVESKKMILLK